MKNTTARKNVEHYSEGENLSELDVLKIHVKWIQYLVSKATMNVPRSVLNRLKSTTEDLIQEANIALLLCWRAYQKDKVECRFTTYAYLRVRGAIIDALREKYRERDGVKTESVFFVDIDELLVEPSYEEDYGTSIDINMAISRLEKWEQNFIRLFYIQGETLKYIGGLANVTESRACQVHTAIINKLRRQFA